MVLQEAFEMTTVIALLAHDKVGMLIDVASFRLAIVLDISAFDMDEAKTSLADVVGQILVASIIGCLIMLASMGGDDTDIASLRMCHDPGQGFIGSFTQHKFSQF
jgi:hypothetical protein